MMMMMVLYIGHPLFFLESVYLSLLYPTLIFDMFSCRCVGGACLGNFLCMCDSVVSNLLVTFSL